MFPSAWVPCPCQRPSIIELCAEVVVWLAAGWAAVFLPVWLFQWRGAHFLIFVRPGVSVGASEGDPCGRFGFQGAFRVGF